MIHLKNKPLLAALIVCACAAQGAWGQAFAPAEYPWYAGVRGGTSFGQATFRSITEDGIHWGAQGGAFAGIGLNRLLSVELGVQYGGQSQFALDCCPYWLSEDGIRYFSPVLDETGWAYEDLRTATQWGKVALQANVNLLSLFTKPGSRWSLNLSPQIAAVTTRTVLVAPDKQIGQPRQWHLGWGGEASFGIPIGSRLSAALYSGITCLTGERFDNIPEHAHRSNLLWDAGVRLACSLGEAREYGQPANPTTIKDAEEAARLAREAAERERIAAEQAAREKAEREAAQRAERERLERERVEREAAEKAAAVAKEEAFQTPIPTVYFANNSSSVEDAYASSLETALPILERYPDFQLEIHAYASRSGSAAYNEKLTERRMEAVRQWYIAHGVAPERIVKAYYHGIDYNAPDAQTARRAEIKFAK